MSEDEVRREFNRWADEGRGRGMEEGHWEITRLTIELMGGPAGGHHFRSWLWQRLGFPSPGRNGP